MFKYFSPANVFKRKIIQGTILNIIRRPGELVYLVERGGERLRELLIRVREVMPLCVLFSIEDALRQEMVARINGRVSLESVMTHPVNF